MTSMKAFGSVFTSVQNTVKTSSGSAVNIVICLVTVGSEQLFTFATFNCPCPLTDENKTTDYTLRIQDNYVYGWVFIVVPAMALFILGYAMNTKTWKLTTGCFHRSSKAARGYFAGCVTLIEIFMQALVAPFAWIAVALLDGKYYACAVTEKPYISPCELVLTKKITATTAEYEANKRTSQIGGWILIAITLLVGSVFYMVHRCCSPLTYHHRKYARWYREEESKAFEKKALEQIKEEVEHETVQRFLGKKRNKDQWDKISTVFNFTRDEKNYALYSRLDEWNEAHKNDDEDDSDHEKKESSFSEENKISKNTEMDTNANKNCVNMTEMAPKIPPPPSNKNAGKRRLSSSSFEEDSRVMASQYTPNMTSQCAPSGKSVPSAMVQNQSTMTSPQGQYSFYDKDVTESKSLIDSECKSMPDLQNNTKSNKNNRTVRIANESPFYGDDAL